MADQTQPHNNFGTVNQPAEGESGTPGQSGYVKVKVEPLGRGSGVEIVTTIPNNKVPSEFIEPLTLGIKDALANGGIVSSPMGQLKVTLLAWSCDGVNPSDMASKFQQAATAAVKNAVTKAAPSLLKTLMEVDITTPKDLMDAVRKVLSEHHGYERSSTPLAGDGELIRTWVPLSEREAFEKAMAKKTNGGASYTVKVLYYNRDETKKP